MTGVAAVRISPHLAEMRTHSRRSATLTSTTSAVDLAVGEPDFAPPQRVVDAAADAVRSGYTHYADFAGDPELRQAVAAQYPRSGFAARNVQITHGSTAALASALLALVAPGDRVVLPDPTFSVYADQVRLAGGVPVPVAVTDEHHLDLESLAQALPGARLFVYCSPVNPSGAVYTRAELTALAEILDGSDTVVIDDAAYSSITYAPSVYTSALDIPGLVDRTVVCQSFSKRFAMTGFRVGWIVGPDELIAPIATVHRTFNGALNSAAQRAALAALELSGAWDHHVRQLFTTRMTTAYERLARVGGLQVNPPEGAFYILARILTDHPAEQVIAHLLATGVRVRPGAEFGRRAARSFRISFAASNAALDRGLSAIERAMATLPAPVR